MSPRRILCLCLLACLAVPLGAEARPRTAGVSVQECVPGIEPAERRATFVGRMRRVPGAERLRMRFTLQQRAWRGERRWTRVDAAGWDEWQVSDAGVRGYRFTRAVLGLAAPAAYRTVVRFRWMSPAGRVLARRRAVSRPCRQPDLRPNLRVTRVEAAPATDPALAHYWVTVRNAGRSRAGPSALELRVDGEVQPEHVLRGLRAGGRRTIGFLAPRCDPLASGVVAVADVRGEVAERDKSDNVLQLPCPLPPF